MTMTATAGAVGRLALTAGAGWLAWRGLAVDPYAIEETHHQWRLPTLPRAFDGLTVCHLSDLHSRRWGRRERDLSQLLAGREPDLFCLTGDYADSAAGAEAVVRLCSGLRARLGIFAVWGNHEYQEHFDLTELRLRLVDVGVRVLANEHAVFPAPEGGSLAVAGVDCCDVGRADLGAALAGLPADACTLLLAHHPDVVFEAAEHGVDLQLSGHTHGGQVRFPLIGALPLPHGYRLGTNSGVFDAERLRRLTGSPDMTTRLYVSRGIGTSGVPVRFRCRPEVAWHTLRAA